METFSVRRVVTGHAGGTAVFVDDGVPPNTVAAPNGLGVSELLWLDGAPVDADAGGDRADAAGYPLEPPPGGLSVRVIRMPPPEPGTPAEDTWIRVPGDDDAEPGMHATDTLDLMMVLDGSIVLGLDDDEEALGVGDAVIQRGTRHRWRVAGDQPCTYLVAMLRPDPANPEVPWKWREEIGSGVRRVVTDGAGASIGEAPVGLDTAGVTLADVWQTGGPLASPTQGGDPEGSWDLEPANGGVAFRWLELSPSDLGPDVGWHTTATIDVDVILDGHVALELPRDHSVELGPGDAVIQRGTNHRWRVLGEEPLRMVAVMIGVRT